MSIINKITVIAFIKYFLIIFGVICLCFFIFVFITDKIFSAKVYKGPITEHFDGKRFFNLSDKDSDSLDLKEDKKGFISFLKWRLESKNDNGPIWTYRENIFKPNVSSTSKGVKITFINHATLLIQIDDINIITDPVFSERASPVGFLGPKRFRDPGIAFDNLPKIDLVLLTHNHYDHLDIAYLKKLYKKFNPIILTGLGNKLYLADRGVNNVFELDWFDSKEVFINETKFSVEFVPAQHFSARGLSDRNKTLWGGFVLNNLSKSIYLAGDTGYGPFVDKIREKYPKGFDIGLIPIGAYKPRWFMKVMHMDPKDALITTKELKIQNAIGIHFGTFPLADDGQDDPLNDMNEVKKLPEFKDLNFIVPDNGQEFVF